jgi:hypothetical protein
MIKALGYEIFNSAYGNVLSLRHSVVRLGEQTWLQTSIC